MKSIKKAEYRIHYNIHNKANPTIKVTKYDLDPNIIIIEIKRYLKSIQHIIYVDVFFDIDLVIITYINELPNIPPLIIPDINGIRIIISFELLKK